MHVDGGGGGGGTLLGDPLGRRRRSGIPPEIWLADYVRRYVERDVRKA